MSTWLNQLLADDEQLNVELLEWILSGDYENGK